MTRLLFIAYHFPPIGGAGVQRSLKFVKYLPGEGFLPTVLAGSPSPELRWTPQDTSLMDSVPREVTVHRVPGTAPRSRRWSRWLATRSEFGKWWVPAATETGTRVITDERAIFATMAPFESGEVARRLAQRFRLPWIADLRDPWALDEMQVYPTLLHRRLEMSRMEDLLSTASLIVMNTPHAAAVLQSTFRSLHGKRVIAIPNGFDQHDFQQPVTPRQDGKFRIVHSGYLHTANGLELRNRAFYRLLGGAQPGVDILTRSHTVLLEALELWLSRKPGALSDVELVLAGKTSDEDTAVAAKSRVACLIRFTGYLPHAASVDIVRSADLLFLPMHDLPAGVCSRIVPGKTYEYMGSGRPILAAVPDGDAREFLGRCGTAFLCRPADVSGMAEILDRTYEAWRKREPLCQPNLDFISTFERKYLTGRLAQALRSVTPSEVRERALVH